MINQKNGKSVYIETFGCQMNKLDSELVAGRFLEEGYSITKDKKSADVILFNTCSVREHAEERVYSRAGTLKSLKRKNPHLVIGVLGCMAQNHQGQVIERLPHVDLVAGPRKINSIPDLVDDIKKSKTQVIAIDKEGEEYTDVFRREDARETPFQAYVKIMEGCDCSCTFCIVPSVRGSEVSRSPDVIVDEVKKLADSGCVEITLLGQTVNSYGKGLNPKIDLGGLLEKVHEVEGIRRIRFITSHPIFVRKSLIDAMSDLPKVCKYLHIPAQSGSNRILKLMKRGYTSERYVEMVNELRENVKGIEIASDFIVGFPTETEEDFQNTVEFMQKVRFQNSFVFKYSPRPGTDAAELEDDVPLTVKKERNQILLNVQNRVSLEKNKDIVDKKVEILVEGPSKSNPQRQTGRTDSNAIAVFESPNNLKGKFINVEITNATSLTLFGRPI
ncbi:MAG: tRNA (N6-isopentenyl adenosine(37)-C2)-methylthiotransferase MiaB [Planctomycetes bacterium RBG_16_43_13]|nr:MAG: tRNA (N6-isopentenyl adenosine(37)-C2)-methylthiotransferase MiaB [Planctomycetes bacterium RBG_16_43_13]